MGWLDLLRTHPTSRERRRIFEAVYQSRAWGDGETVSGPGSGVARASLFRADFEALIRELSVRSLLDAPCGDFNWLRTFDLTLDRYIGVDIVPALITQNRARFGDDRRRRFLAADMVRDRLPRVDLILCRDGLVHLCDADVLAALRNFKRSGSHWLLTNTFVDHGAQADCATGGWRPLNLELAPFNLPSPAKLIDEQCLGYGGQYRDKRLALWSLQSLPA